MRTRDILRKAKQLILDTQWTCGTGNGFTGIKKSGCVEHCIAHICGYDNWLQAANQYYSGDEITDKVKFTNFKRALDRCKVTLGFVGTKKNNSVWGWNDGSCGSQSNAIKMLEAAANGRKFSNK